MHHSLVVTNGTTCGSAEHGVVPSDVPGHAANGGAGKAAGASDARRGRCSYHADCGIKYASHLVYPS
jgi:hypothetical protein